MGIQYLSKDWLFLYAKNQYKYTKLHAADPSTWFEKIASQ